ncbi:MAG: DNA gyrase C-terminal beta-propeller domain-containing protein, partial [Chloroflexota bacterium]
IVGAVVVPHQMFQAGIGFISMATLAGQVKRVRVEDLPGVSGDVFPVMRVDKGDSLGWTALTSGTNEVILSTAAGYTIRFSEDEVRPMACRPGALGASS